MEEPKGNILCWNITNVYDFLSRLGFSLSFAIDQLLNYDHFVLEARLLLNRQAEIMTATTNGKDTFELNFELEMVMDEAR